MSGAEPLERLETEKPAEGVEEVLLRKIVVVDVSVVRCPVPVGATKPVVDELLNQGRPVERHSAMPALIVHAVPAPQQYWLSTPQGVPPVQSGSEAVLVLGKLEKDEEKPVDPGGEALTGEPSVELPVVRSRVAVEV